MARLLIRRNSEWANKMRSFGLYLNGKKIAEIKDKQLLSFEIPAGRYQLQAKIDWCGSQLLTIEISEAETKRVEITGFIFSRYFLPVTLITGILYFIFYLRFHSNSLVLGTLLMFFLGYFIYFISFGRYRYLRLKEI